MCTRISADKFLIFQHMDWMRVDWTAWHFLAAPIAIVIVGDDFTSTENIDRSVQEKDKQTARKREAMRCNERRWKEKNTNSMWIFVCKTKSKEKIKQSDLPKKPRENVNFGFACFLRIYSTRIGTIVNSIRKYLHCSIRWNPSGTRLASIDRIAFGSNKSVIQSIWQMIETEI